MVAWLAKVPVFHSVNLALSANGGSNPARDVCALKKMSTLFMLSVKISKKFEFSFQTNKYLLT